jgi:hypothetical protein
LALRPRHSIETTARPLAPQPRHLIQAARRHADDQPPHTVGAHRRQFPGDEFVMPARCELGSWVELTDTVRCKSGKIGA